MLVIKANKKANKIVLDRILYIYNLLCFYKNKKNKKKTLINSNNKINIIMLAYLN